MLFVTAARVGSDPRVSQEHAHTPQTYRDSEHLVFSPTHVPGVII